MENLILRINYSRLRNEVHVELHETTSAIIERFVPDSLGIGQLFGVYKPLVIEETSLLDTVQKSGYTVEIEEQDSLRDSVFRGLADAVKSSANHFNPDKRAAAEKIAVVFDSYGNIAAKPLDQETAAIDDLIRELRSNDYPVFIDLLGLNDWVMQLDAENRRFKDLMLARYSEKAQRPALNMRDIRTKVDRAFLNIVYTVEVLTLSNGIGAYEPLIRELNAVIERYKNILARQHKKSKSED